MKLTTFAAALVGAALSASFASAATLDSGLTQDNGQRGIMFDIVTGSKNIELQSLSTDFYAGVTGTYELYFVEGGYAGFANTPAAWTLHDSISGFTGVSGNQSWDFADLYLTSGTTYGLYLTTVGSDPSYGGIQYASLSESGALLASDGNLSIFGGVGRSYPFGTTFSPRGFAGSLTYEVSAVPLPAAGFLLMAGLGGLGLMRRRRSVAAA